MRLSDSVSHLQTEAGHDRLMVANAIAHVAVVFILVDHQGVLIQAVVRGGRQLVVVVFRWRVFGFDPPQDTVGPRRLPLLAAR